MLLPAEAVSESNPIKGNLQDSVFLLLPKKTIVENKYPLNLYFNIDQKACKKKYGKRYYSSCRRNLKLAGKTVRKGISISPRIKGEWKWDGDYYLTFTPVKPWEANQKYKIFFDKSVFPEHVSLNNYTYHFDSRDFSISIPSMKFFQDPDDPIVKIVATRLTFNYPVDKKALESRIAFSFQDRKNNKLLREEDLFHFRVSYNSARTEANLETPLTILPGKEKAFSLVIDSGTRPKGQKRPTKKSFRERVRIPSLSGYYRINSTNLSLIKNDNFETDQALILDTNVKARPEEITKRLSVYLLPKYHPTSKNKENKKPHRWSAANEVSASILKESEPLKFSAIPVSEEFSAIHSLKLNTEPGRYVYVKVEKGVETFGGFTLSKDYKVIVRVPEFPRELSIMQAGGLLALSGEKKISILARGLDGLKFEVAQVLPQYLGHLVTQTRGNFDSRYFTGYNFDQKNISEIATEEVSLALKDAKTAQFASFDFAPYLKDDKKGLFFLNVYGKSGKNERVRQDRRFILITDLGFLVKKNSKGTREVFVQSISTGQPVEAAQIQILGNNGLAVFTVSTDSQGRASVPNLKGIRKDKQPAAIVVSKGSDLSFMAYDRYDRNLNFSKFPVSGRRVQQEGLQAFLFSDRGIYRPGDNVDLAMIVKPQDWSKDLEGVPLELNIIDPRGVRIKKERIQLSVSGFEEYQFKTEPSSPTGRYHAHLYISNDGKRGSLLHSTSVRVEEFLPDRMKIRTDFNVPLKKGWVHPEDLKAKVNLKNLYGTPATDRRVTGRLKLSPAAFLFDDFKDYSFFNAWGAKKSSMQESLPEMRTDANGDAEFDLDLVHFGPASLFLNFRAEGFEAGSGRSVAVESNLLISPMDTVIGYKTSSNLQYLKNNQQHTLHWIALDSDLNKAEAKELTLYVIRKDYISTLVKRNGRFAYEAVPKERIIDSKTVNIGKEGLTWKLDTSKPGDYALVLMDFLSMDVSRVEYSVAGETHVAGRLDTRAELKVKLDKAYYEAGEEIELNIVAPYIGSGLITIEGDRVYAHRWFKTDKTDTIQKIKVPETFEGNGFINVAFTRALGSKEIYMSPLSYAVAPFTANIEKRRVHVDLEIPDRGRPGAEFSIQVKTNKKSRLVLFAVDEGILQVAQYKTPKPLDYFLKGRSLDVTTAQILDLLMPEYSMIRESSAAGGGDGAIGGKHLNPFRRKTDAPVVFWSGIIGADENPQTLTYKVPSYFNGTLRVMAVAVSDKGVGSAEQKALVQGDYIVSPNTPVFVAPGDICEVTATIANNLKGSGESAKIPLSVAASEHLTFLKPPAKSIEVAEGKEETLRFKVKAKDILGSASLQFSVGKGEHKAQFTSTLSVRPANPKTTLLNTGYMEGKEKVITLNHDRYEAFAETAASISVLPTGLIDGLSAFLQNYPYACTEQTVSRAYPSVILAGNPDFDFDEKVISNSIMQAVDSLRTRQTTEGGFSNWATGGPADPFPTTYALDFLTDAKEKGFPVPPDLVEKGLNYLKNNINQEIRSLNDARTNAYGIYVLTRNGEVTTNYVTYLMNYIEKHPKVKWSGDLIQIYLAAAFKMMKQGALADTMVEKFKIEENNIWPDYSYYNSLVKYSQYATLLAKHFPDHFKELDRKVIFKIANFIGESRYNSLSSAYAIQALAQYSEVTGALDSGGMVIERETEPRQFVPLNNRGKAVKRATIQGTVSALRFKGSGKRGLFYQVASAGFEKDLPKKPVSQGLEITRQYLDMDGEPAPIMAIGEEIEVVLTLHSHENKTIENVAIVDLLPGGFDLVIASGGEESTLATKFIDRREDRIVVYATVTPEKQTFRYKIRATNFGTFTIPPPYAESMYDSKIKARGISELLDVF